LELLPNVPLLARKLELILDIQTDHFWEDITPQILETVRRDDLLTKQDLQELEAILLDEGVANDEHLNQSKDDGGFALFPRSLTGLDKSAAKDAISKFVAQHQLNGN
jgi:type I site-specific restriction endonuclease